MSLLHTHPLFFLSPFSPMMSRYAPPLQEYHRPSAEMSAHQPERRKAEHDSVPEVKRCEAIGIMQGEQVEVRIRGNVWIVGILVSTLHLISYYLGQGYDVEYRDYHSGKVIRGSFPTEDVRPVIR